jgi:hypothetical protein
MEQTELQQKYKEAIQYATDTSFKSYQEFQAEFAERFIGLLGLETGKLFDAYQKEEERRDYDHAF